MNEEKTEKNEVERTDYRLAMVGIGQAGCQITESVMRKVKKVKNLTRYADFLDALGGPESPRVWAIDLGKGVQNENVFQNIPNRIWAGQSQNIDGAGGNPFVGEQLYDKVEGEIKGILDRILQPKPNIVIVAFSASGGTGASWGPILVREIMNASKTTLHIYAFIVVPMELEQNAGPVTISYSLGRFMQYYEKLNKENKLVDSKIIPILLSNEQIINKLQKRYPSGSNAFWYRVTNVLTADVLTELLYTTISKHIKDYVQQLDPNDIGAPLSPDRPFIVVNFSQVPSPEQYRREGTVPSEAKSILRQIFEQTIRDFIIANELNLGLIDSDSLSELAENAESEPLKITGSTSALSDDFAITRLFPIIYGVDEKLVRSDILEEWSRALVETKELHKFQYVTGDTSRNLRAIDFHKPGAYAITLDKTEDSIDDDKGAHILTLLYGPKLKVFDELMDSYKGYDKYDRLESYARLGMDETTAETYEKEILGRIYRYMGKKLEDTDEKEE